MSDISNTTPLGSTPLSKASTTTEPSFDDIVLQYIKQNKPQGTLSELMEKMRALSSDKPDKIGVTMQQLNQALLYSDTYLRNTEEAREYTHEVLDRLCIQLQGVNIFFNNMMSKSFTESDDDTSL